MQIGTDTLVRGTDGLAYRDGRHTVWTSADGQFVYTLIDGSLEGGGTLEITGEALAADDKITIRDFHNGDLGIELNAERRIALLAGVQTNPFDADGYTPETAAVAMRERGAQTFTIALSRPGRAGERIRLQLDGGPAGAFVVVTGGQTLAFTNDVVELALTAGQAVVTVSIQHEADADALETLTLSARLVDAAGAHSVAERTIELQGEPEAQAPDQFSNTIEGDRRWKDFDPDESGIQVRYDALGNIITEPDVNPGQADDLNDSAGKDEIYAGGGADTVEALRGGDDLLVGGDGRDYLYGGPGADLVHGGGGSDSAGGGQGDDTVVGESGNDFLSGGEGNDRVFASDEKQVSAAIAAGRAAAGSAARGDFVTAEGGDDTLVGGSRSDVLAGAAGDDLLIGGGGNDFITGDEDWVARRRDWRFRLEIEQTPEGTHYAHSIEGAYSRGEDGSGDDVIHAGGGDDYIVAGAGNDLLHGEHGADIVWGEGGDDTLLGGEGDDRLFADNGELPASVHGSDFVDGGAGNDQLYGYNLADTLFGGDGDDVLSGDGDADYLSGEAGDDELYGGNADDFLAGGEGQDNLIAGAGKDTLLGGMGNDELTGDASNLSGEHHGDDRLDGGLGVDQLVGGGANDLLFGGQHNDWLYGDSSDVDTTYHGVDLLDGGAGDDQLYGDSSYVAAAYHGADQLTGGQGSDWLVGGGGGDSLLGGAGDDTLNGDDTDVPAAAPGSDTLSGGAGIDRLFGMGGTDVLDGGAGVDGLAGGAGADTLSGGVDHDWLSGGDGADVLDAGTGGDRLDGGAGDDSLIGGDGFDTLSGGGGSDRLLGGGGFDLYRFGLGDGLAFIQDTGSNTLRFGYGIWPGTFYLGLGSLKIGIKGTDDAVHIEGFDPNNPYRDIGIDRIEFADGTVLSYEALLGLGFDLRGTGGDDVITGTVLEDRIRGLDGDDTLIAKAGNDLLDGGAGADRMEGNAGDDRYVIDQAGDVVVETAAEGRDQLESQVDYRLGDHVEDLTLTGLARRGVGNAAGNAITGNAADNVIAGLGGDDRLHGGAGDDALAGGAGADTLAGGAGADRLKGGAGGDFSNGGFGDDTYVVDRSAERVIEQRDLIDRTPVTGRDGTMRYTTVMRSGGYDRVLSSATFSVGHFVEDLTLTGSGAIDGYGALAVERITGNGGDNALYAYGLNGRVDNRYSAPIQLGATLDNGAEERLLDRAARAIYYGDTAARKPIEVELTAGEGVALTGGAGDDRLFGDWDNDTLRGGIGNDVLYGSAGADTLVGGQGDDTYVVNRGYQFSFRAADATISYRDQSQDTLIETAAGGVDTIAANIDFVLGEHFENLTLLDDTGAFDQDSGVYGEPLPSTHHASVGIGNAGDNRIVGNRYDNRLDGAAGADRLVGGGGNDTYVVDQTGDAVVEAEAGWRAGNDTVETDLDYTLGKNVENLVLTGAGDRTGTGNALGNRLHGNAGANALSGLAGADALHGESGTDALEGGSGDDRLDGGSSGDRMRGGAGDDRYVVEAVGDRVIESANAGYDHVASSISRALTDNIEHLRLTGDADIEGEGNALDNRIEGNAGSNRLHGHAGADRIAGGGADDVLAGDGGDDWLDGGAGDDVMVGGTGDDHYIVGSRGDRVSEAAGTGHDRVWSALYHYTLTANVEDLTLAGLLSSDGGGNALDNRIAGNDAANALFGRAGDDIIYAAAGNDAWNDGPGSAPGHPGRRGGANAGRGKGYGHGDDHDSRDDYGDGDDDYSSRWGEAAERDENDDDYFPRWGKGDKGDGDDDSSDGCSASTTDGSCNGYGELPGDAASADSATPSERIVWHTDQVSEEAGGGYDIVYSSASFVLPEHVEELRLTGSEAIDATGSAGDDALYDNIAANHLEGAAGADILAGGEGDDTYVVRDAADTLVEQAGGGVDTVESAIDYGLGERIENLTLTGTAAVAATGNTGGNVLTGNGGDNTLTGLAGSDTLRGGGGADTLRGGEGNDVYVYTPGHGVDRIEDTASTNVIRFGGSLGQENIVARTTTAGGVTTVHLRLVDIYGNELHDQGVDFVLGAGASAPVASVEFSDGTTARLQELFAVEKYHEGSFWNDWLATGRADDVIRAGGGFDRVTAGGCRDTVYGGARKDALLGLGGDDRLSGGSGRDRLAGGMGFDAIEGGGDADTLRGDCQSDLLLGGAGRDCLAGGAGADAIAGGAGDDRVELGSGTDVVLFNAGDDHDWVELGSTERLTLSLGGELRLEAMSLHRRGDDLTLRLTASADGCSHGRHEVQAITFEDWYDQGSAELPTVTLQMVMEASAELDPASNDPRRNRRFTRYDLNALASDFDNAGRDRWSLADALLDAHLESSAETALGGELAYRYGLGDDLSGLSTAARVAMLSSPRFGERAQHIGDTAVG